MFLKLFLKLNKSNRFPDFALGLIIFQYCMSDTFLLTDKLTSPYMYMVFMVVGSLAAKHNLIGLSMR